MEGTCSDFLNFLLSNHHLNYLHQMNGHICSKIYVAFTCLWLSGVKKEVLLTLLEANRFFFGYLVVRNLLFPAIQINDAKFRCPVIETFL